MDKNWIKVSDRLPDEGTLCLVYFPMGLDLFTRQTTGPSTVAFYRKDEGWVYADTPTKLRFDPYYWQALNVNMRDTGGLFGEMNTMRADAPPMKQQKEAMTPITVDILDPIRLFDMGFEEGLGIRKTDTNRLIAEAYEEGYDDGYLACEDNYE